MEETDKHGPPAACSHRSLYKVTNTLGQTWRTSSFILLPKTVFTFLTAVRLFQYCFATGWHCTNSPASSTHLVSSILWKLVRANELQTGIADTQDTKNWITVPQWDFCWKFWTVSLLNYLVSQIQAAISAKWKSFLCLSFCWTSSNLSS